MNAGAGARPQASSTRAQSFRSARNLAMVRNWSASAAMRKKIMRRASSSLMPAGLERAHIFDRDREREGELLRLRAAGIVDHAPIGDRERPAEALPRHAGDGGGE